MKKPLWKYFPEIMYCLAILAFLAGEIRAIFDTQRGNTASSWIRYFCRGNVVVAAACGSLARHLFGDALNTREAFEMGWVAGQFWPCVDARDDAPTIAVAGDLNVEVHAD